MKKVSGLERQAAAVLGRLGGKVGGKRSLETMTAKQRVERAKKAAAARWAKAALSKGERS